jgi:hypothetical protein
MVLVELQYQVGDLVFQVGIHILDKLFQDVVFLDQGGHGLKFIKTDLMNQDVVFHVFSELICQMNNNKC